MVGYGCDDCTKLISNSSLSSLPLAMRPVSCQYQEAVSVFTAREQVRERNDLPLSHLLP